MRHTRCSSGAQKGLPRAKNCEKKFRNCKRRSNILTKCTNFAALVSCRVAAGVTTLLASAAMKKDDAMSFPKTLGSLKTSKTHVYHAILGRS